MGYIATYFVHRTAKLASERLDGDLCGYAELCRVAGVDPSNALSAKKMITDTMFFELLEHVVDKFAMGYTIAVRVGSTMQCNDYGAFGFAFKTACNLSGSFQRVERYGKLVTSIANFMVDQGNRSAFMAIQKGKNSRLGLALTNELAIAAATSLCREVSLQPFTPDAVYFSHEAPPDSAFHENYFQCPVHFESDRDGLVISNDMLFAGNRLGDQAVSAFFDTHLDIELAELVDERSIDLRVARQITKALSEGAPSISDIARQMGMSSRTLQRRLSDEGLVYQELVDNTRRDLAVRLLEESDCSLVEIAFLTGYAEQSTFTRAFKRWYGQTPSSFRRSMH